MNDLKIIYSDIVNGFSSDLFKDQEVYIKHLSLRDSAILEQINNKYLTEAIARNVPTLAKHKEYLEKENLWTDKDEAKIEEQARFLKNLEITRKNLWKERDLKPILAEIKLVKDKIYLLEFEKGRYFNTITAESYANKKLNEYLIYHCLYKAGLKERFFSKEWFDDLDEKEISELSVFFNKILGRINENSIKKLCVAGFFLNSFYLCEDNCFNFYGKPIVDLTYNQSELFSYGRYFKQIIGDLRGKVDDSILTDPDKLIESYESGKVAEKAMGETNMENGATSLVGASKADLAKVGIHQQEVVNFGEEARKLGKKNLDLQDLLKIHGEI